jgi:hypothetical protein
MQRLVFTLLICTSGAASAQERTPADDVFIAQERYARASELYRAGDRAGALAEFRAAYELVPSPNTRLMIARSLRELERFAEAVVEYELAEREAHSRAPLEPRFAETVDHAGRERAAIEGRVARIEIALAPADVDARIELGARVFSRSALGVPIPIEPGPLAIRVYAEGYRPYTSEIETRAGEVRAMEVSLEPALEVATQIEHAEIAPSEDPTPLVLIVTGSIVAAAGLGLSIAFGWLTQERYDEVRVCAPLCPPAYEGVIAEGRAFEAAFYASAISAGIGLALAIVGLALDLAAGREPRTHALLRF